VTPVSSRAAESGDTEPGGLDRYRLALWIVAATALVGRVAAAIILDGFRHPEIDEYDVIAKNMLADRGFTYTHLGVLYYSYIAPLPAWTSAASYWLTGSIAAAVSLQIVAGTVLAPVTAAVARRLFGGWMAPLVSGLLVATHPGLVLYSAAKVHALAFDSVFFTLTLLQSYRVAERPTVRRAAELGVIVGAGTLSRATIIIFLPIAGLWLLLVTPTPARRMAQRGAIVAALCGAAVVAPWTIRNSLLHHRFVFLLTTNSEVFWRGNNPYATGGSYIDNEHIVLEALPPDEMRDLERQPDELAQARWFQSRSAAFIKAHPVAFVRLTATKFLHFWWFSSQTGMRYPRAWLNLYMAYYVVALVLAATGVWKLVQERGAAVPPALLLATFLIALSGLQSLYYVEGRHRWAVESMLLALSGGGAVVLLQRIRVSFPRTGSR
jgi:4-amino-4-deoxy-L-arabinose transferase-like glycosyltransferase